MLKNDLNGDGFADLVFQYYDSVNIANPLNGRLSAWFMNGATLSVRTALTPNAPLNSTWELDAIGDFDRDKKTDLVFKKTTANVIRFWLMNGTKQSAVVTPAPDVVTPHSIRAAADFDGDTKLDLVLQNSTNGKVFIFRFGSVIGSGAARSIEYLGATEITPPAGVGYPNPSIRVYGAADFNGDGRPDLAVQNKAASGATSVWYMGNTVGTGSASIPVPNQITVAADLVRGLDDMNGDGQLDLIIQNGAIISIKPRIGTTGFNFGPKQSFSPNSTGSIYTTIRNN